jgi:hypothetical protein
MTGLGWQANPTAHEPPLRSQLGVVSYLRKVLINVTKPQEK